MDWREVYKMPKTASARRALKTLTENYQEEQVAAIVTRALEIKGEAAILLTDHLDQARQEHNGFDRLMAG